MTPFFLAAVPERESPNQNFLFEKQAPAFICLSGVETGSPYGILPHMKPCSRRQRRAHSRLAEGVDK